MRHRGLFHGRLTDLRFCCAANVVTASEAREVDGCRDGSNRLLERRAETLAAGAHGQQTCQRPYSNSNAVTKVGSKRVLIRF